MLIRLTYTRLKKPRGGYGYPLHFHFHLQGNRRGWWYEFRYPLGSIWVSIGETLRKMLAPGVTRGVGLELDPSDHQNLILVVQTDGLLDQHCAKSRPGRSLDRPCLDWRIWYTRTAQERELLIDALHQAVEVLRQDWMQFWRDNPPMPGDTVPTRHIVALPAPEDIYFAAGARQYTWENDQN